MMILLEVNCRHCKARKATIPKVKRDGQQKVLVASNLVLSVFTHSLYLSSTYTSFRQDNRLVLTMEDLSKALQEGDADSGLDRLWHKRKAELKQ